MKFVLDTNVLVSALIKAGKPRELLFKIAEGKNQLFLSRSILEEFLEVADDPRIRRYVDEDDVIAFMRVVGSIAKIVRVRSRFKVVKEYPLGVRLAKLGPAPKEKRIRTEKKISRNK